ncbi:hypothetical protein JOQ06_001526 [Pogonophryne albipinna]|uniref:Uncharacterized protein n=2 Tax=Pogonophryne albipinna TaxID=1090488 RepID=A0AAD6FK25_9TELE|nr:hypothetical protein JOQ06_001526 [Pogonophryne albipinna]
MAAPYVTAVRTLLKGVCYVPERCLLTQRSRAPAVSQCSQLHVSPAASLCSSKAGAHSKADPRTDDRKAGEQEEEEEGPEYMPRRKAKNPMMPIGYAWMIGLPAGIIGFLLTKREVDKNRLKQRKVRQRMRMSNEGEYEGSRYRQLKEDLKLER